MSDDTIEEINGLLVRQRLSKAKDTRDINRKAARIGELLTEHQNRLTPEEFREWVEEALPFSLEEAQVYMDVHAGRVRLRLPGVKAILKALREEK